MPVQVIGLESGVDRVASGTYFSCAVLTSGGAKCWGHNDVGQHGDGTDHGPQATDVSGLITGVASISASYQTACALTTSGDVKCWGGNSLGQLRVDPLTGPATCGTTACSTTPIDIGGLSSSVAQVAIGDSSAARSRPGARSSAGGTTHSVSSAPATTPGLTLAATPSASPSPAATVPSTSSVFRTV
jgi:alpha-tubulin suppressor-like RCC1 family protein